MRATITGRLATTAGRRREGGFVRLATWASPWRLASSGSWFGWSSSCAMVVFDTAASSHWTCVGRVRQGADGPQTDR
jgi:hypothetical protein